MACLTALTHLEMSGEVAAETGDYAGYHMHLSDQGARALGSLVRLIVKLGTTETLTRYIGYIR
jgi:hypothetical protein